MCGILGGLFPVEFIQLESCVSIALNTLRHRGPNDSGSDIKAIPEGYIVLGHTRLSIIDLSSAGHQPMKSRNNCYSIVFNGEIYNYRELKKELVGLGHVFVSDSDTEVLLAAWAQWGQDALVRLKGMFAFVIFDAVANTLTCVRDAFGIKPFFYSYEDGCFAFASEVPALLHLLHISPSLNLQRAYDYLVFGSYDDQEQTFFNGVKHLLPGHLLTFDIGSGDILMCRRWWWPSIKERSDLTFAQASSQLREMFLDNIRLHLRSDVPLGAALSGGVDSSAVVCVMRHVEPDMPIHTFSYVARDSVMDEEVWADRVNLHVGAISHKVIVSPEELAYDLDDMIRVQGEPFGSTSIYAQYRVFKLAKEQGITVTLDGQGADELLAGYHGYPGPRLHSLLEARQFAKLVRFASAWSGWPERSFKRAMLALGNEIGPGDLRRVAMFLVGHTPEPKWLKADILRDCGVQCVQLSPIMMEGQSGRRLMAVLRSALVQNGLPTLLRHGDRNSMRWSVESRVPFLTSDMAEFLLSLPEEYLISSQGETKHVFRAAMRGIVPDVILDRKDKIGFATPERDWLNILGPEVAEWMDGAEALPFLHVDSARQGVGDIITGKQPFSFQAWRLINFCRWIKVMEVVA